MSASVFGAAMVGSLAEGNDRNVLMALADAAGHDGVTWLKVGDGKDDQERTICRLARVSKSTALRAIAHLRDDLGEIQTVKVRRERSFVTVYRVLHAAQAVDYSRIPFEVPHAFDEQPPIHGVKLTPSVEQAYAAKQPTLRERAADVHGVNLTPSTDLVHGVTDDDSRCQTEPVHGVKSDAFTVSHPRARERNPRTVREPAAGTVREPDGETVEDPAAAESSASDREIAELVLGLPGADADSPKRILPIAHSLPRRTIVEAVETVLERRASNPCGLLTHLLRIARAERTALLSAPLQASIGGGRSYTPAPWTSDAIKRHEPERYVRIFAPMLADGDLREALHGHDGLDGLLELAAAVRAGREHGDPIGTPEQERRRWVDRHAANPDVGHVIDAWDDVDPLERQALHELAERIGADDSAEAAA